MSTLIVGQLTSDGDICGSFANVISKSAATAQKCTCRLKLIQGEWFLDPDAGVPWFALPLSVDPPIMGVRPVDLGYVERTLKMAILDTVGISKLVEFANTLERNTRASSVTSTVETDDGDTENIEVLLP